MMSLCNCGILCYFLYYGTQEFKCTQNTMHCQIDLIIVNRGMFARRVWYLYWFILFKVGINNKRSKKWKEKQKRHESFPLLLRVSEQYSTKIQWRWKIQNWMPRRAIVCWMLVLQSLHTWKPLKTMRGMSQKFFFKNKLVVFLQRNNMVFRMHLSSVFYTYNCWLLYRPDNLI
jgi:hypothetical protein